MSTPSMWSVRVQGAPNPAVVAALGDHGIRVSDVFGGGSTSGPAIPEPRMRIAFVDASDADSAERLVAAAIDGLPALVVAGSAKPVEAVALEQGM